MTRWPTRPRIETGSAIVTKVTPLGVHMVIQSVALQRSRG